MVHPPTATSARLRSKSGRSYTRGVTASPAAHAAIEPCFGCRLHRALDGSTCSGGVDVRHAEIMFAPDRAPAFALLDVVASVPTEEDNGLGFVHEIRWYGEGGTPTALAHSTPMTRSPAGSTERTN
jgi:hypothetical protein